MPKLKSRLSKRLGNMADDIQIGGDIGFRALAMAAVLAEGTNSLTSDQRRDMERLIVRANKLLADLDDFWERYPTLHDQRADLAGNDDR